MDAEHLQMIAARDQFWSTLRTLLPDIQQLADGSFDGSPRQTQMIQLIAKIVVAELQFRAERAESE